MARAPHLADEYLQKTLIGSLPTEVRLLFLNTVVLTSSKFKSFEWSASMGIDWYDVTVMNGMCCNCHSHYPPCHCGVDSLQSASRVQKELSYDTGVRRLQ
eukprot:776509-Amphidinium_carterae.1